MCPHRPSSRGVEPAESPGASGPSDVEPVDPPSRSDDASSGSSSRSDDASSGSSVRSGDDPSGGPARPDDRPAAGSGRADDGPRTRSRRAVLAAGASALATCGCLEFVPGLGPSGWTSEAALPSASPGEDAVTAAFRRRQLGFSLELLQTLADDGRGSFALSPFSLSSVLSLLAAGGTDAVQKAVDALLGGTTRGRHRTHAAVVRDLATRDWPRGARPDDVLAMATAVWHDEDVALREPVAGTMREYYGAAVREADLADPTAQRTIDRWIRRRTGGRIDGAVPEGALGPNVELLAVDALQFEGEWSSTFDPDDTESRTFYGIDGTDGEVPVMHQEATFGFGRDGDLKAVELPYAGEDLVLDLVSCCSRGFRDAEASLTPSRLRDLLSTLEERDVSVYLPRFTLDSEHSLLGHRAGLGLGPLADARAFAPSFQDAAGALSTLHQTATLDVAESGTIATGVTMGSVAVCGPVFRGTRPFLFFLRDRSTGTVLFAGRVVDPEGADDSTAASR